MGPRAQALSPQPILVSWWPCVGRPQLSTQPLPSVLPPVRAGGCCGPPATAQRDAGARAGREQGLPAPCRHLPAPCLLHQGLPHPQFCPHHLCRGRNSPRAGAIARARLGYLAGVAGNRASKGHVHMAVRTPGTAPAGPPAPGAALSPLPCDLRALRRQTNGEGKQGRGVPPARGCLRPAGGRGAVCSQPVAPGGQRTSASAGASAREHVHPCHSPCSDKSWHTRPALVGPTGPGATSRAPVPQPWGFGHEA